MCVQTGAYGFFIYVVWEIQKIRENTFYKTDH